jgi:hypothetical protein
VANVYVFDGASGSLRTFGIMNILVSLNENVVYKNRSDGLLTLPVFGVMIGQSLHERNGMGCAVSAMLDAAEEHDNGVFRS